MQFERIPLEYKGEHAYMEAYVSDYPGNCDAMLVIPGGGYHCVCSQREGEPIALSFLSKGINCFVLHYSVAESSNAPFPQQLIEASLAVQYIREHAEQLHVNPDRVFAVGFSAGGHLAASLATLWHYPAVTREMHSEGINRPTGVLTGYPVISCQIASHKGSFQNLWHCEELTEEQERLTSLELQVDEKTSPMFLMHTADDAVVPVQNSLVLANALAEHHIPFELHIYPHAPHGVALGNFITGEGNKDWEDEAIAQWIDHAVYWMRHLV